MAKDKDKVAEEAKRHHRPVSEIISQMLAELSEHPDVNFGNCAINGPCPAPLMFKDTPRVNQHFTELRIAYRDSQEVIAAPNKEWKWAKVIEDLNKPTPPPAPEPENWRWKDQVPKKQLEEVTS